MEAYKGSPLFFGHRAWGSLLKHIFVFVLLVAGYAYLYLKRKSILHYVLFTYHYTITVEYALILLILMVFLSLLYRHYVITYVVTTQELIHQKGIIAVRVRRYTYTQVQEAVAFQTFIQRLELWGSLTVTMLISRTGQAVPETAVFQYMHRPMKIANRIMENIKVGS